MKSIWLCGRAIVLLSAFGVMPFAWAPPAAAQSAAATYISAVDLDIVPAEREKFLAAAKENGEASVKEPGCQQYIISFVASNPDHIMLIEVYNDAAASQAHRATEHFKKYQATVANMVAKREVRAMTPVALFAKSH